MSSAGATVLYKLTAADVATILARRALRPQLGPGAVPAESQGAQGSTPAAGDIRPALVTQVNTDEYGSGVHGYNLQVLLDGGDQHYVASTVSGSSNGTWAAQSEFVDAQQTAIPSLTDNSGGAAADGTIGAVTAPTALAASLTDNTGLSGTHDDTLAATSVPADATGGEDPTEAEFNALLAVVRVMAQNQSDVAQKVIELVTAQGQDRTAIVALTDAVKELATKLNAILAMLRTAGILAT